MGDRGLDGSKVVGHMVNSGSPLVSDSESHKKRKLTNELTVGPSFLMSPGPNNDEVVGQQQQQQQHQQEEIELQVYEVDLHHEAEPHHMSLEILDPLPVEGIVIPIVEHRKLVKDDMIMV